MACRFKLKSNRQNQQFSTTSKILLEQFSWRFKREKRQDAGIRPFIGTKHVPEWVKTWYFVFFRALQIFINKCVVKIKNMYVIPSILLPPTGHRCTNACLKIKRKADASSFSEVKQLKKKRKSRFLIWITLFYISMLYY